MVKSKEVMEERGTWVVGLGAYCREDKENPAPPALTCTCAEQSGGWHRFCPSRKRP